SRSRDGAGPVAAAGGRRDPAPVRAVRRAARRPAGRLGRPGATLAARRAARCVARRRTVPCRPDSGRSAGGPGRGRRRPAAAGAAAAGARLLLVRRPGRAVRRAGPGEGRRWAYVESRPGQEGVWWGRYTEHRELLDVLVDRPSAGDRVADPVYLVCTHGSHDA